MADDIEVLTRDPYTYDALTPVTRKERMSLLGLSALGIALAWVPLVPQKLSAFGVEFNTANQVTLVRLYAAVVFYYLVAFILYVRTDYMAWNRANAAALYKLHKAAAQWERDNQPVPMRVAGRALPGVHDAVKPVPSPFEERHSNQKAWATISMRYWLDAFFPIGFGVFAIGCLFLYQPDAPKAADAQVPSAAKAASAPASAGNKASTSAASPAAPQASQSASAPGRRP